uniref:Uncharacterized protein n=1 Tax=Timema poppense TaxID=170557 RepID=A0A7R9GXE3_TIMPO|nr:unnamed protein product [Timema poppensis]
MNSDRAGVMKKNNRDCHSLMKCAKRQDKDSLPRTSSLCCCEVEHEAEGSLPVTSLSELMCSPASAISLGGCEKNVSSTKRHQDSRESSRKAQNSQHILYLPTCRGPLKICVRPATNLCNKEESSELQYACGESPGKSPEKMHILHITTSSSDSSFHSNSNSLNRHKRPKCPMKVSESPIVKMDYDKDHGGVYRAKKFRSSSVSSVEECEDTLVELPIEMLEPEQVPVSPALNKLQKCTNRKARLDTIISKASKLTLAPFSCFNSLMFSPHKKQQHATMNSTDQLNDISKLLWLLLTCVQDIFYLIENRDPNELDQETLSLTILTVSWRPPVREYSNSSLLETCRKRCFPIPDESRTDPETNGLKARPAGTWLTEVTGGFGNRINLLWYRGVNPGSPAQNSNTLPQLLLTL